MPGRLSRRCRDQTDATRWLAISGSLAGRKLRQYGSVSAAVQSSGPETKLRQVTSGSPLARGHEPRWTLTRAIRFRHERPLG